MQRGTPVQGKKYVFCEKLQQSTVYLATTLLKPDHFPQRLAGGMRMGTGLTMELLVSAPLPYMSELPFWLHMTQITTTTGIPCTSGVPTTNMAAHLL
jgi:hypothetical protein